jgi:hypothetical protein
MTSISQIFRRTNEKGGPRWPAFQSFRRAPAQLPVALSTLIETPGPMVELIDTFFM